MLRRVCIFPAVTAPGGVGSFYLKFSAALRRRGIEVVADPSAPGLDALLVLAGTRHLPALMRARRRGLPLIHRLDGINWVQRKRWTGPRYTLRAEYGNLNLAFIRRFLADRVVYQSAFTQSWWTDWYGAVRAPARVIHNGVDLDEFAPGADGSLPADRVRLLVVEGSLAGGLDWGLRQAVRLAELLAEKRPVELVVAGRVDPGRQASLQVQGDVTLRFLGIVPRAEIPALDRSAHLFFSAELNPPCPNAVIEALACGLPVVGFDTGALRELVPPSAGRTAPYGGDPWKLDPPDLPALARAAEEVLADLPAFRQGARAHAEAHLGLEQMTDRYLEALQG